MEARGRGMPRSALAAPHVCIATRCSSVRTVGVIAADVDDDDRRLPAERNQIEMKTPGLLKDSGRRSPMYARRLFCRTAAPRTILGAGRGCSGAQRGAQRCMRCEAWCHHVVAKMTEKERRETRRLQRGAVAEGRSGVMQDCAELEKRAGVENCAGVQNRAGVEGRAGVENRAGVEGRTGPSI